MYVRNKIISLKQRITVKYEIYNSLHDTHIGRYKNISKENFS